MFSIIVVKHGNLVDVNRAFYILHRKNGLDYPIVADACAGGLQMQPVRTYPTRILVSALSEAWSLVRGNSSFDLAPIAKALSGALSTTALSLHLLPQHEEAGLCCCHQGRELRRITHRHGRSAASGEVQDWEPAGAIGAGSPFGAGQLADCLAGLAVPIGDLAAVTALPAQYRIARSS